METFGKSTYPAVEGNLLIDELLKQTLLYKTEPEITGYGCFS